MHFLPVIEAKRDGQVLSSEQIRGFVSGYVAGQIPDYQVASFLMAVFFRGLTPEETATLTLAMRDSGDVLTFPADKRPLVDKHSTGGVGDKVSLPLAPLLACLGFRVPMISGRGLGITGGTLDKLESIPGFQTALTTARIAEIVQSVGCVICGQTERMVPADKKIYALRDVTGTVPSIALITASILSKKLAESLSTLLLDVKFGRAAFMPDLEKARALAQSMVTLGNACGVNTRAILTDMDTPLGTAAGNWLEVRESVACLEGKGPEDLEKLVVESAAHLLIQNGWEREHQDAWQRADNCLRSGQPLAKWEEMLVAQGADLKAYRAKLAVGDTAPVIVAVPAPQSGYIQRCDARILGEIIRDLGGGRLTKDTVLQPEVGMDQIAKPGRQVQAGETLARVHTMTPAAAEAAVSRAQTAFGIGPASPALLPLVREVIG